ncbi:MAG: SMP-30/gluconolactonase/LRE family protein [Sphingobium sp.]
MTIVTIALKADAALGECPRWQAAERRLYWVDIARSELHRLDPATGRNETRRFDAPVGCFAFTGDSGLLLGMKDGFALLRHWDGEPEPFGDPILAGRPALRMNDGRADSHGRFWAGSVNMEKSAQDAALYRLDRDGSVTLIEDGMLTCNGAAFDAGDRHFHHADTPSHMVRRYDVDPDTGTLSNRTIFHRFPNGEGRPDGGSFDAEGYYWSALFDGGRVVRLSPGGDIVQSVPLPVSRPTMIAFGGEDLRTAFVTSARTGLDEKELALQPLAGSILSFPVDVPGLPEQPFRPA